MVMTQFAHAPIDDMNILQHLPESIYGPVLMTLKPRAESATCAEH